MTQNTRVVPFCAGRENQTHWVAYCIRVCVCFFFFIGSAADVETGRVGFVGLVQMSTLLQIIYSKPDFYCWPNDINSVKLFTWEKIILTKLLKISSHGTFFFFGWVKEIPRINYFSCWGNFWTGIKAKGFLFVNCAEWVLHFNYCFSVCVLDSNLNAESYFFFLNILMQLWSSVPSPKRVCI